MTTWLKPILQKVTLTKPTQPKSVQPKSVLPEPSLSRPSLSRPSLLKASLPKASLPKAIPFRSLPLKSLPLRSLSLKGFDLTRVQPVWAGFLLLLANVGRWAWSSVIHYARVANDVMHRRPPRFETGIAVGTFAFIVVAAVAGFLMLGGVRM